MNTTKITDQISVANYLDHHPSCSWHLIVEGVRKDKAAGTRTIEEVIQRAEARYPGKQVRIEKW